MAIKLPQQGLSGNPAVRADQLDEAALRRQPRCQCDHEHGLCGRPAAFRISSLCAGDGCQVALDVTLMCRSCKEQTVAYHESTCGDRHRLRVTAL
jgi:hypothetical protein